jgi:hypothetical protein
VFNGLRFRRKRRWTLNGIHAVVQVNAHDAVTAVKDKANTIEATSLISFLCM